MHFTYAASVALLRTAALVHGWLPGEHRQIVSRDGVDLFDRGTGSSEAEVSATFAKRFLPANYHNDRNKIRGVNLGALFVLENWLADNVMSSWGCNDTSEFNCVASLNNQAQANSDFQGHWQTWVNATDFSKMVSYGLNTVRIPLGYWFFEQIVTSSEHFPQGGEQYLDQVVGYAKDAGLYVIIDLHGAPGAQSTGADTGQYNLDPGFYDSYNYNRTYSFFSWLTTKIHTNSKYTTVGMVMLVNEPERLTDTQYAHVQANDKSLVHTYYPIAISTIRAVEDKLGVPGDLKLHIQMMDSNWGSGNSTAHVSDLNFLALDDHAYVVNVAGLNQTKDAYLDFSCHDDRSGSSAPLVVSEWSLAVNPTTSDWDPTTNIAWYRQWWAAQVTSYEKTAGWVFWTWKTTGSLNDPRWDYQKAVAAGLIPTDIDSAYAMAPCAGVVNTTSSSSATTSAASGSATATAAGSSAPSTRTHGAADSAMSLPTTMWSLPLAAAAGFAYDGMVDRHLHRQIVKEVS